MTKSTQTLTLDVVVDAVNEVLAKKRGETEPAGPDTPLESLGLTSLEVAELFALLEERSGVELDPESARWRRTVGELTELEPAADEHRQL